MEKKKIGIMQPVSRSEIIKWIVLLATIISAFYANRYTNQRNKEEIKDLKIRVEQLEICQQEMAIQAAINNTLLIEMHSDVKTIKDFAINGGFND